jgi:hypothetical protein
MALSKIQPASMDLTANYAFTGTNSVVGIDYAEKKLATQTASSSGTLQFTSSIDSTYNIYKFRFINMHPSDNEVYFQMNLSTDGGSNYNVTKTTTVFIGFHKEDDSSTALQYQTGDDLAQSTSFQRLTVLVGNGNDESTSGELFLFNPSSTTFVKHFLCTSNDYERNDASSNTRVAGYANTTSAIDAIQFKMSSGNIDSGTIEMYGIN